MAATSQNIYRWDGHGFQRVSPVRGRVDGRDRLAVEDARHVLVVDDQRLYRLAHDGKGNLAAYKPVFSDRTSTARPELAKVASVGVTETQDGNLRVWFGCGKRLCSLEEREADEAPRQNVAGLTEWGREQRLPEDTWDSVLLSRDGTLWAGGDEHVAALPKGAARFSDRTIPGSNPHTTYEHAPLIEDREGRVLTPCDGGIARWQGSRWQTIGRRNGLQLTGSIAGMVFDASGDLWFAAHGNGLYDFVGYGDWEGWAQEQGLPSSVVWAVAPSGGDLVFVGTDNGPARISLASGTATQLIAPGQWKFGEVAAMGSRKDGGVWAGTFSGQVLRIDPGSGAVSETAKLPELITGAVTDSAGRLIFATKHALWLLLW